MKNLPTDNYICGKVIQSFRTSQSSHHHSNPLNNLLWTIWWKALTLCFLNHFPSCCWVVCEILSVNTTSPHINIPRCRVMCDAKCTRLGLSEGCPVRQRHWIRKFLTCSAVSSRRRVKRSAFRKVWAWPDDPQLIYNIFGFRVICNLFLISVFQFFSFFVIE